MLDEKVGFLAQALIEHKEQIPILAKYIDALKEVQEETGKNIYNILLKSIFTSIKQYNYIQYLYLLI